MAEAIGNGFAILCSVCISYFSSSNLSFLVLSLTRHILCNETPTSPVMLFYVFVISHGCARLEGVPSECSFQPGFIYMVNLDS